MSKLGESEIFHFDRSFKHPTLPCPASRGPSIFLDRKIEGPLLAGEHYRKLKSNHFFSQAAQALSGVVLQGFELRKNGYCENRRICMGFTKIGRKT